MKYLAILKDSVREALDSKVLFVLVAMSVLVIVVVAGFTFEPQPASLGLLSIVHRFPGATALTFQEPEPPAELRCHRSRATGRRRQASLGWSLSLQADRQ